VLISAIQNVRLWLTAEMINGPGILLLLGLNRTYSAITPAYGCKADLISDR